MRANIIFCNTAIRIKKLLLTYLSALILMLSVFSNLLFADTPANKFNTPFPEKLRIALPPKQAIEAAENDGFRELIKFLKEYWQVFGVDNQVAIEFVRIPSTQVYSALLANEIDVAAITIFEKNHHEKINFSIPYAKFSQRVYHRLNADKSNGIQLGIHALDESTLQFIGHHVERTYFTDLANLLNNYQQFDSLYSEQPWLLDNALRQQNLLNEFYVSTDETPQIHLRFATAKYHRKLLYALNKYLREIEKLQVSLWQNKYPNLGQSITLTLGDYLTNLSEDEQQFIIDNNELTYPILESGFPPYLITRSYSNITERGLMIDIITLAQQRTGIIFKPRYVSDFQKAIESVNNKDTDLFVQIERRQERQQDYIFSIPVLESTYSVVYKNNAPLPQIHNLSTEIIATVKNFNVTTELKAKFPNAQFKLFNSVDEAVSAVSAEEATVFVGRSLTVNYIIRQNALTNLNVTAIPSFRRNANFSFAALERNDTLIMLVNRVINSISATELENLSAKWSKTALSSSNNQAEISNIYRQASYIFFAMIGIGLIASWVYYRQWQLQEAAQQEIKKALVLAEQARISAEESAQAKISFLARMSHEIRTPMNGVLGMAEALEFSKLDLHQEELLKTLRNSAQNLMALLNDVLDFSKIDAGKLTLESVPINLTLLTNNVVTSFKLATREKQIVLDYKIDDAIHYNYFSDPTRLTQVLNNLLSNAIKFTEKGSVILSIQLVKSQQEDGQFFDTIGVSIKDSGIGISAEHQSLLFTPFVQADDEITRKFGGTGLGLSICQEIVEAMGGVIQVESEPEVGSTFYFKLKLQRTEIEQVKEERRKQRRILPKSHDNRFDNLRILMAEDNLVNVQVLNAQLKRINISADIANDGAEALAMYRNTQYDIILSDCHMPNLDGFELAKTIRAEQSDHQPWLIAITADALSGTQEKCLAAGFDDYMSKPCRQEDVSNKLHHAYREYIQRLS